jgi:hypothetical protein
MSVAPSIECVDHVHVFVSDRLKATQWYLKVMGMEPVPDYLHWADGGGPLVLSDKSGSLHLACASSCPNDLTPWCLHRRLLTNRSKWGAAFD